MSELDAKNKLMPRLVYSLLFKPDDFVVFANDTTMH